MDLAGLRGQFTGAQIARDDDAISRLSSSWSPLVLVVCAIIVTMRQYVGIPIKCWFPQEFIGAWKQYGENICFIKNTYFVPPEEHLPNNVTVRTQQELAYYQWVPYFFMCIAFVFYVPKVIWRLFNWQTGIHVQTIVTMACDVGNIKPEKRKETTTTLSKYIEDAILKNEKSESLGERVRQLFCFCFGRKRLGSYLTSLYLLVKVLYVVNIILQFFIMNSFLGTKYKLYGYQMLHDLNRDHEWTESGHFPRVTMCDFTIRVLGQKAQNYTVQCVLMINLFNEKIFIFLWFWYVLVAVASICSLVYWCYSCLSAGRRLRLVRQYLKLANEYQPDYEEAMRDFVQNRLRVDGVLLLQLIGSNAGGIVTTELVQNMWNQYKEKSKYFPRNHEKDSSITPV